MIRRLLEDTSQHLMEEVSGTWEHSKGSLTLPPKSACQFKYGPYGTLALGPLGSAP